MSRARLLPGALLGLALAGCGGGESPARRCDPPPPARERFEVPGPSDPTRVPAVVGRSTNDAARELDSVGLRLEVAHRRASPRPHGEVIEQRPRASARTVTFTLVRVTVSDGPDSPC